jgi:aminoglycoside phosphotransferase (APT) family kinase protein
VLDWEMATLGDPLADVGLFLVYWGRDQTTFAGADMSKAGDTGSSLGKRSPSATAARRAAT